MKKRRSLCKDNIDAIKARDQHLTPSAGQWFEHVDVRFRWKRQGDRRCYAETVYLDDPRLQE